MALVSTRCPLCTHAIRRNISEAELRQLQRDLKVTIACPSCGQYIDTDLTGGSRPHRPSSNAARPQGVEAPVNPRDFLSTPKTEEPARSAPTSAAGGFAKMPEQPPPFPLLGDNPPAPSRAKKWNFDGASKGFSALPTWKKVGIVAAAWIVFFVVLFFPTGGPPKKGTALPKQEAAAGTSTTAPPSTAGTTKAK